MGSTNRQLEILAEVYEATMGEYVLVRVKLVEVTLLVQMLFAVELEYF